MTTIMDEKMLSSGTALLLVSYQNDYFGETGLLHQVVEESSKVNNTISNTIFTIANLPADVPIVTAPMHFTPTYEELIDPVGILKMIKDIRAFQAGTEGAKTIAPLLPFGDRIIDVRGKRGFNAFAHTNLDQLLRQKGVTRVAVAGAITSICIDSTGRGAHELGYQVSILSDCTAARTLFEQDFYCQHIFPTYAEVLTHQEFLNHFTVAA
ncbi:cysteine hydrolase family protein [Roseofilum casamattae]|uniref:Cysteine hydrolase n=1 Tax=Roseofilum casamattae BLCC-M143 TaxID=3022442 RepID=A0ABT7BUV9_9CYAN|nr:isochorismatase family cysteine hydrolase [Roseofilum casamattae]MDJ1182979.1 cysteine hydrolase [Roseofilum casamattae BLCC-M143]